MNSSSYGTAPYPLWGVYFIDYWDSVYSQYTNHIHDIGQSGSASQFDYQNNLEKWGLVFMHSFPVPWNEWVMPQDNGGYASNDVVQWFTNMFAAPPLFWNGTAVTNEGVTCQPATYYAIGGILADSTDQTLPISRNAGSLFLNGLYGTPSFDLYHELATNGWTTDQTGARVLGFQLPPAATGHPLPPGDLAMSTFTLLNMNVETNIGAVTLDASAVTVTTNHCVVTGFNRVGNLWAGTIQYDRMPPGYDVSGAFDARGAFAVMPFLANSFQWNFAVQNLPTGNYGMTMDGVLIQTGTAAQFATGFNLYTNYNGWLGAQRIAVLYSIRDEMGLNHTNGFPTHTAGEAGVHGVADDINFKSHGNNNYDTLNLRGSALVTASSSLDDVNAAQTNAVATHMTAVQTNHAFAVFQILPRYLGAHR